MIVESMTSEELIDELYEDMEYVRRKAPYLFRDLDKIRRRTKVKTIEKIIDYRSPKKNNWILILRMSNVGVGLS